jgi:hypothetical protein
MLLGEWLKESRGRYLERVERLATLGLTNFEKVAFVICTPQQPYERAVTQWKGWRRTGKVEGSFAPTRATAIHAARNYERAYGLGRASYETGRLWSLRLARSVRGLGPVKAPFAVCLMAPLAKDVPVCMDLWMARLFGFEDNANKEWSVGRFEGAQRQVKVLVDYAKMPPFPTQWAAWDWKRSAGQDEQPMWVRETDIANDLKGE